MAEQVQEEQAPAADPSPAAESKPHCGIIMPISDSSEYDPGHWLEVRRLVVRAAQQAGYTAGMVSENDGQDVIHRSIVKNIYHNDLVVCDVSSLNPNVMLELGLRMANKKPLIVIFDGEGVYPFDIKNMLYIPYPKGLHHFKVETFVQELTARIKQVTEAAKANKYEPFLNHFNDVVIEQSELGTITQSMADMLASLVSGVNDMKAEINNLRSGAKAQDSPKIGGNIFTEEELSYLRSTAKGLFRTNPGLSITDLVEATYKEVVMEINTYEDRLFYRIFGNKLQSYQLIAKDVIRGIMISLFSPSANR